MIRKSELYNILKKVDHLICDIEQVECFNIIHKGSVDIDDLFNKGFMKVDLDFIVPWSYNKDSTLLYEAVLKLYKRKYIKDIRFAEGIVLRITIKNKGQKSE